MSTPAHRGPSAWTIAGWNRRASHALWDRRIGRAAAEELAVVRLPAYRALAAFLLLVVLAALALLLLPPGWPVLPLAAAPLVAACVLIAFGLRPLRRAGRAVRDALAGQTDPVPMPAPLNDGARFDAWVRRHDLDDRLRREDLAGLLRGAR